MIIENIKNLVIAHKIENNKEFYANLRKLDPEITTEEAYEIMYLVNPKKTTLINAKTEEEFLDLITVNTFETKYVTKDNFQIVVPYKGAEELLTFIRGEELAVPGEIYTDLAGKVTTKTAKINPDGKYIVIKENTGEDITEKLVYTKKYEVIVYMP